MRKGILKLYGEIYDWNINSAENFTARLNTLDSAGYDVIDMHVHGKGGDVLEGIAIYNAIKAIKTPVDFYVDGVAASMYTIVMLACRRVFMASNSFLMIHAPSGFIRGTAKTMIKAANALSEMEQNFIRDYSAKTGKPESEVSEWLDGGDNWFSARQALGEKIIDGVVDAVDTKADVPQDGEVKDYTVNMLYQRYAALAANEDNVPPQKQKSKMNKDELIKKFGLTSVTAESSEEQIYAAIDAKLQAANDAKEAAENKLKDERSAQITAIVNAAKEPKKLTDAQVQNFVLIGESAGIEALQVALGAVNPVQTITGMLNNGGNASEDINQPKTFSDIVALGDVYLAAFKKEKPEEYKRLYRSEFGHDINL